MRRGEYYSNPYNLCAVIPTSTNTWDIEPRLLSTPSGVDLMSIKMLSLQPSLLLIFPEYNQKSFSTINSDILKFHDWLIENNCYHVCMESTGKYWIPVFNLPSFSYVY